MMEENNKLNIRLHVYDTDIPVKVLREDEYFYREAAKLITNTVNTYSVCIRDARAIRKYCIWQ